MKHYKLINFAIVLLNVLAFGCFLLGIALNILWITSVGIACGAICQIGKTLIRCPFCGKTLFKKKTSPDNFLNYYFLVPERCDHCHKITRIEK